MPGTVKQFDFCKNSNEIHPASLWENLYLAVVSYHAGLFIVSRASCPRNELSAGRMPAILGDSVPADVCGLFSIRLYINNFISFVKYKQRITLKTINGSFTS